jgi:predicted AAA+ superfamily ATPase
VSPVVLLIGPRQSGKTTLIKAIGSDLGMKYLTFDTLKALAAAQDDPEGFVAGLETPIILDEVQRVPEIALPIKLRVDEHRQAGSFGLTGSANPLVAPKLNDSLAGRMFILNMWPLSVSEIQGQQSNFLAAAFDPNAKFSVKTPCSRKEVIEMVLKGGYPDALLLEASIRDDWFDNLLTTILERDVQDISHLQRPRDLAKLLSILATRSASLLNLSDVSRSAGIAYTTLNQYMAILESLFLVLRIAPWYRNRTKRLTKMPKLYFGDTGLLANQLGLSRETLLFGPILENFVLMELKKLSSWLFDKIDLYHFRTDSGHEVDIVLENRAGQVIGIEVKASETLSPDDWKGLLVLESEMEDKMVRGIIFYLGKEVMALGKNRIALPISVLWDS